MGPVSLTVVFLLTWWMVLFMVLPWGLERDENGTPTNPHLRKKIIITTGLSIVITVLIYIVIQSDLISFREMAQATASAS